MKIEVSPPSPPFALSDDTQAKSAELFTRIAEVNQCAENLVSLTEQADQLRAQIGMLHELSALLDSVDSEKAEAVAKAGEAVKAAEDTANKSLVDAKIATEESLWYFAETLSRCQPVIEARETLQRHSEWHTQGTRGFIQRSIERAGNDLLPLERQIQQRQAALTV